MEKRYTGRDGNQVSDGGFPFGFLLRQRMEEIGKIILIFYAFVLYYRKQRKAGMMITIEFNGKAERIAEKTTVREFLDGKKLTNPHLILEWNGEILPQDSSVWMTAELKEGDRLNAFSLVGGG